MSPSSFEFTFKDQAPFGEGLSVVKTETRSFDETWQLVVGTCRNVRNHYNELAIELREVNGAERTIKIVARAFDDGIAFRYVFPKQFGGDSLLITQERSEFNFPANDSAWWIPADEFAYESIYRHTRLSVIPDANTPMTIETRNGLFLCVHEAALTDYSEMAMRRSTNKTTSFASSLWPEPAGVSVKLDGHKEFHTPWRCIIIGRKACDLVESHLVENLNEPGKIADVSWIKPIKFVGIWWGMHIGKYTWYEGPKHGATTERAKQYIDFASAHHIGGMLAEGWNKGWETWASNKTPKQDFTKAASDFDLRTVVDYARLKNVEFISHHETGGNIPEYERQLDSALTQCERLGIHYLKTGYAGPILPAGMHHHGQFMVRHFQKVVEAAAKHQICLDVHESIKPTGLSRTWPNLLTQEAARGNEWNATYNANPPSHNVTLPFTRLVGGPFDATPGILNVLHTPEKNKRIYSSLSSQLAFMVVCFSPMLMASDLVENYEHNPAFRFIEDLPATWDTSIVIHASIGHEFSVARKRGERWFFASLADEHCYQLRTPLSFLDKERTYIATIYGDSICTNWDTNPESFEVTTLLVTSKDSLTTVLAKAGGQVVEFTPIPAGERPKVTTTLKAYNTSSTSKLKVFTAQKTYGKNHMTHVALHKPVILKYPYSERYPASGKNALTDGTLVTLSYSSGGWQGFLGNDLDATIDLGKPTPITQIETHFLNAPNDWIFLPSSVEFFISTDSKTYTKVGEVTYPAPTPESIDIREIKTCSAEFPKTKIRYIRVIAHSIGKCPEWHSGKGQNGWLLVNEVLGRCGSSFIKF